MNNGINVLSLFDGISCGQQALELAGIKVDKYFASEIDKYAIKVTQHNYPNTIQLGSVIDIDTNTLPKIDLLIGGSPCTNFSFAGKMKGMVTADQQEITTLERYIELKQQCYEFEGQSYLFWEYVRILHEVKPKYFLLENVPMAENWRKILSATLGVNEIRINANLVSAQNRERWFWTNIGVQSAGLFGYPQSIIEQPKDNGILLKDILQPNEEVDSKYFLSDKMISYLLVAKRAVTPVTPVTPKYNTLTANYYKTPTDGTYLKTVKQINPCLESGGKQPFQQNRVYDSLGISPALCSNKSDSLVYSCDFRSDDGLSIIKDGRNQTLMSEAGGILQGRGVLTINQQNKLNLETNTDKANCLTEAIGRGGSSSEFMDAVSKVSKISGTIRKLTPIECERLQCVKDNYSAVVSDTQRYKMLGNGWTVDVIAHIFSYLKF